MKRDRPAWYKKLSPYQKYLRSDHWLRLRLAKLEEAGHCCNVCGSRTDLEVHHIYYPKRITDTRLADLEVVCPFHHAQRHHRKSRVSQAEWEKQRAVVAPLTPGTIRHRKKVMWKREAKRLDAIQVPKLEFIPDTPEQLLWCQNEFFTGAAVYQRKQGQWRLVRCAPCLNFLRQKTPAEAKLELARRGYEWRWISPSSEGNAAAPDLPEQGDGNRAINDRARQTNVPGNRGGERLAPTTATAALQHRCSAVASVFPMDQAGVVNNGGQHSTAVGP